MTASVGDGSKPLEYRTAALLGDVSASTDVAAFLPLAPPLRGHFCVLAKIFREPSRRSKSRTSRRDFSRIASRVDGKLFNGVYRTHPSPEGRSRGTPISTRQKLATQEFCFISDRFFSSFFSLHLSFFSFLFFWFCCAYRGLDVNERQMSGHAGWEGRGKGAGRLY